LLPYKRREGSERKGRRKKEERGGKRKGEKSGKLGRKAERGGRWVGRSKGKTVNKWGRRGSERVKAEKSWQELYVSRKDRTEERRGKE